MAAISISASLQRACSSHHVTTNKQQSQSRPARSLGSKQATHVVTLNVDESPKSLSIPEEHHKSVSQSDGLKNADSKSNGSETEFSGPKFVDERWKKGTWDLNMFVKDGQMDWDGLILAEAKRRKFLEMYPEISTNEEPVLFRSSIIPWWAWLKRSYLPEAELINGRAAMVGFLMSYVVDGLTGLDMVGQAGNFICKAGLFVTVISIMVLRRTEDFNNLKNLADEATLYDNQWRSSWKDSTSGSDKTGI
ncbi:light-harvesting complex-like protein 3 isotype 1, chloroplastic [Mercurialis annua]|uniref:light-harvesting complex-like protein 3 isotype 1, chloroplastic n=1 Tax=Mercurialis annua TaxID=3986 RepID=UPI0021610854|nr:light-harvesting complex-like protein 3 isotype 1, chloroplastic [Mercurialis annua]